MRQSILIALLFLSSVAWGVNCPSGYAFVDTVTVAAQGSQSGNLTNYAEPFTGNNAGFQTTGGHVLHSSWPLDIVPCTGPGTGTVIPFEIVPNSYSATAGTFEMWLSIPAINKSSTSTFYVMVGNASPSDLTCNQNNTAACMSVFTNCISVQHTGYNNGSTNAQVLFDSCANVTGTNHSSTAHNTAGFPPVSESANFTAGQWYDTGVTPGSGITSSWVMKAWIANADSSTNHGILGNLSATTVGMDVFTFTGGSCVGHCIAESICTNASNRASDYVNFDMGNAGASYHLYEVSYTTGGSGHPTIYIDGTAQTNITNGTVGTPGDAGNSTSSAQVGSCGAACAGAQNWLGNLDEIDWYSVALTADQAKADNAFQSNPTAQYTNSFAAAGTTRHRAWVIQSGN